MKGDTTAYILAGTNGTGKTFFSLKKAKEGNYKRIIILTPDDLEDDFRFIQKIEHEKIATLKSGAVKIVCEPKFLKEVYENIKPMDGTLIIFDDPKSFLKQHYADLLLFFRRRRHNKYDIIINFHGVSDIISDMYTYSSHFVLFKTTDAFLRKFSESPFDRNDLIEWRREINEHKNHYYHKIIELNKVENALK